MYSDLKASNKKLLFFSPHSSIWQHSFPESILADHLKKMGFTIEYMGCNGILSDRCTTIWKNESDSKKNYVSISEKIKICKDCIYDQKRITKNFMYKHYVLEDFLSSEDTQQIKNILKFLKKKKTNQISRYCYQGIEIGKFALYETLLAYKKSDLKFSDLEKKKYLEDLRGCLISLFAFKKFLKNKNYYGIFLYNSNYGKNRIIKLFAEKLKIKVFSIHAGGNIANRLQTLMITLKNQNEHDFYLKEKVWVDYKSVSLNKYDIKNITSHFQALLEAKNAFVYSSAVKKKFNFREYYNIEKEKKILLIILSSPDETISAKLIGLRTSSQKMFRDTIEWIRFLIKNYSNRKDVVLIIRPHPREFPNKREGVLSANGIKLSLFFNKIKKNKNIIINLPTDNISIYNLIPYCDSVLTMGSTTTIESTLLGIPCVTMSKNFVAFPNELVDVALNKKQYIKLVDSSINKKFNLNLSKKTFRWMVLTKHHSTLNFSNLFYFNENSLFFKILWKFFSNLIKNFHIAKYKMFCNYSLCQDLKHFFNSDQIAFISSNKKIVSLSKIQEDLFLIRAIKQILKLSYFNRLIKSKLRDI